MINKPAHTNRKFYLHLLWLSVLLVVFTLWTGWIHLLWVVGVLVLMGVFAKQSRKILRLVFSNYWVTTPLYMIGAILLAIFVRVFIFEVYTIPSGSMKQTILPGDKIFASKLHYGPYIPASLKEVPWLKIIYAITNRQDTTAAGTGQRLPGITRIKQNDVIVFKNPENSEAYIKRCAGLPGDTIRLDGDKLYVNGNRISNPPTVQHDYLMVTNNDQKQKEWAKDTNIRLKGHSGEKSEVTLTFKEKTNLIRKSWVDSLLLMTPTRRHSRYAQKYKDKAAVINQKAQSGLFGKDSSRNGWKQFHFGPLYIPAKGEEVLLNEENLWLYKNIIQNEGHRINTKNGKIFIDGKRREHYRFRHSYYFMLGDNRCHSSDSRSWGFVPKYNIIGKAVLVLFSNTSNQVRWKRFFTIIK